MPKIFIFNGPTGVFKDKIPSNYITLTELARTMDSFKNTVRVISGSDDLDVPKYQSSSDTLVIYADEFHGLNEGFVLSFVQNIAMLEFDNIYLQNPPSHIFQQFEKLKYRIEEEDYKYKAVTKSLIKKLDSRYEEYIIGQKNVKREILLSLIPLLNRKNNKSVVLMFYGPTGVGKTETAKFISKILGGKLFRKQFSMFQNNSYSTYLYGGSVNEDSFALDLLGRETNVILLDEFDKVGSHFHSAFYELFDEGTFTDRNYKVNMKRSIIICTSNYGSDQQIKKHLGEAIYSRFDNLIEFGQLGEVDKIAIINMKVNQKLDLYSTKDRSLINSKRIKTILYENLELMNNVREIDKSIQKLISLELLNDILKS